MDILGIEISCVLLLSETPEGWYLKSTTEDVIRSCSIYPKRLVPFYLIDPRFGDGTNETDFSQLLEEYKERGCVGIGEMIANLEFDDPRCINLYLQAGKFGFPVLFDMDNSINGYGLRDEPNLPRLEKALRLCEKTIFIGHGPTFWAEISDDDEHNGYPKGQVKPGALVSLLRKYDNLRADLSAYSGFNAITRDIDFGLEFLNNFSDKLLFGTDVCLPYEKPKIIDYFQKIMEEKKLTNQKHQQVTRDNATVLLGL
ncbi:MAG TPA: hypothetical protein DDX75_01865 [Phycisphaerales bacterium]|nr:hypothetical protein [Phycisphaerales bacterium]